jgi:hypothetical protein
MSELDKARARIEELERACGAAAVALYLDIAQRGQHPADAEENSAVAMVCAAVGLDRTAGAEEVVRFLEAYMTRFSPKENDDG